MLAYEAFNRVRSSEQLREFLLVSKPLLVAISISGRNRISHDRA
jgi:hypothetical protein